MLTSMCFRSNIYIPIGNSIGKEFVCQKDGNVRLEFVFSKTDNLCVFKLSNVACYLKKNSYRINKLSKILGII